MDDDKPIERPLPRSMPKIFEDLRALAQSDGALHEISNLLFRDHFVTVDLVERRVTDNPEHRWSTSRLNANELLLLLGLMVQSSTDRTFALAAPDDDFAMRADSLLREFHDRVISDIGPPFDRNAKKPIAREESIGLFAREAIYYGPAGFYVHQFLNFSRDRYGSDTAWFFRNVGMSIEQMLEICRFILDYIGDKATVMRRLHEEDAIQNKHVLTYSLLIAKEDIRKKFGDVSEAFFEKFVTRVTESNNEFTDPFCINAVALAPIIELGDYLYVPIPYRLCESVYESPFYWMMADSGYSDTHAEHRGTFLETTTAAILRRVFGPENVHENVSVMRNTRERAGEIDVLVVYGEFVIVVQAKSKRITLKARAGGTESLKADFEGAIQTPYQQALDCIEVIKAGAECIDKDGNSLELHQHPRFFPMVTLSDSFPASTLLSRAMLKRSDNSVPVIWDIGVLDCIARLLSSPLDMLFYLKCRSDVFDSILSDSEYNYVGYHIQNKLAMGPDINFLSLGSDFSGVVDDFMITRDAGIEARPPAGILEQLNIPVISELLTTLKNSEPMFASVVVDLYDFSSTALENLSTTILELREEISASGKSIKALSLRTGSGGLTYAVTRDWDVKAAKAAQAIGRRHKYESKCDRWYVIVDSIQTDSPIDGLVLLVWPWTKDEDEARAAQLVAKSFRTRMQAVTSLDRLVQS